MEAVGARLGRSSTRYGPPSTVFNGPVRKWKKKWIHESPSSNHHSPISTNRNGTSSNGNNGSHLLLYKWTPSTQSPNNLNSAKDEDDATNTPSTPEEPPRRKFKYIPIAVLEEQEKEVFEKVSDEAKPSDTASNAAEPTSRSDGMNDKPDINDLPMEEIQAPDDTPLARQDLNQSTLDLSLGFEAHDSNPVSNAKRDQS